MFVALAHGPAGDPHGHALDLTLEPALDPLVLLPEVLVPLVQVRRLDPLVLRRLDDLGRRRGGLRGLPGQVDLGLAKRGQRVALGQRLPERFGLRRDAGPDALEVEMPVASSADSLVRKWIVVTRTGVAAGASDGVAQLGSWPSVSTGFGASGARGGARVTAALPAWRWSASIGCSGVSDLAASAFASVRPSARACACAAIRRRTDRSRFSSRRDVRSSLPPLEEVA